MATTEAASTTRRRRPSALLPLLMLPGIVTCSGPAEPDAIERLRIAASPASPDTVTARPIQALVVEVRDEALRPASGLVVRFQGLGLDSVPSFINMLVASEAGATYGPLAADTTNASGRAAALVAFGTRAGIGRIQISVPEFGLVDTASFTVTAGAPARIQVAPADSAVYAGARFQLRAAVADRFNNPRSDPVSYQATAVPAGAGAVSPAGEFQAISPGRVVVTVTAGSFRDSSGVSVVPMGTLAAYDFGQGGIILVGLDGSGRRRLGPQLSSSELEPAWAPDGGELAFSYLRGIGFLNLQGELSRLYSAPQADLGDHYWPAYSPDGQFVFFSGAVQGRAFEIWRARRNGADLDTLTSSGFSARPSVAPSGQAVAYHAVTQTGLVVVRVLDLASRNHLGVDVRGRFPEWSPRGDLIAFWDDSDGRIKVMQPSGAGVRTITAAGEQPVAWSPDGVWLVVRQQRLMLFNVDVSMPPLPLPFSLNLLYPAWRPAAPGG